MSGARKTSKTAKTLAPDNPKLDSDLELLLWLELHDAGLPMPVSQFAFAKPRRWRADFAWLRHGLLCEVNGGTWQNGRHNRASSIEREYEKLNAAAVGGWHVVQVTRAMIEDGRAVATIRAALEAAERRGAV